MNPSKYLGNEKKYLEQVLNSETWSGTLGNWNNNLERKFADRFGMKYAIAMNSGTATLHSALAAYNIGIGDEVISPALTVIMDSTATLHAGAKPVYADVDRKTFNIDPQDIERKITPKTRAIIVVSLYGLPCDMYEIMRIANKHNLVVIEDNAQCVLGKYMGRLAGTLSHIASFSFESSKHLSCGEGGIVVTNDEIVAERVRKIAGHGYKNLKAEEGRVRLNADEFQKPSYKRHDTIGWNYRMPEFNAAIALAQLERIDELVGMRIKSANMFLDVIKDSSLLTPQYVPEGYENSYYTLACVYNGENWEAFRKRYIKNGGDGIYGANSVPYQEPVLKDDNISCPVAEYLQSRMMQFKTNYRDMELAKLKADSLYKTLKEFA